MDHEGHTLQDAIRMAQRQRDIAKARGFHDVAAFWDNELWTMRAQVHASLAPTPCEAQ